MYALLGEPTHTERRLNVCVPAEGALHCTIVITLWSCWLSAMLKTAVIGQFVPLWKSAVVVGSVKSSRMYALWSRTGDSSAASLI